MEELAYMMEK